MTPAEDKSEPEFIVFPPMPGTSIGQGLSTWDSVHYTEAGLRDAAQWTYISMGQSNATPILRKYSGVRGWLADVLDRMGYGLLRLSEKINPELYDGEDQ